MSLLERKARRVSTGDGVVSVCGVRCVDRVTDQGGDVHLDNMELR